jgi:glycosyltransferase involved in cell wall biosynthesis
VVHAISDSIVDTFGELYGSLLDPKRTLVAHIGRADELDGRPAVDAAVPPSVLFVGRLEPRKGIDVFLRSAITILAEHPGVRIVVAGDANRPGPDGVTFPLWWARQGVRSEKMLEFVGEVDDDRLSTLLDDASIVVMPSRYESFGLVVVEAMMHARPAVASAIGGIRELINDGKTGVLVPVDDSEALAIAVGALLDDPVWAADIGQRARDHFVGHLTSKVAAGRLEQVLLTAIESFADDHSAARV